jgi:hypothetical protein
MSKRSILVGLLWCGVLALGTLSGTGCSSGRTLVVYSDKHGPPPHAPAHGYRCKHRHAHEDVELVYDSSIQVYVVVGRPQHYFLDGYYFRVTDGGWYSCKSVSGPWVRCSKDRIPPGLAKRGSAEDGGGKGKGKGHSSGQAGYNQGRGHDKH